MVLKNILSHQDAICLLELIQKSLICSKEEDFKKLIDRLGLLIPFDFATCLVARMIGNGTVTSYNVLNINYPEEWLDLYVKNQYYLIDPVIKENFTNFSLQYWANTYRVNNPPSKFLYTAEDFGLENGYSYGIRNPGTINIIDGSLFSISSKNMEYNPRTEVILEQIIPHFHQTLARIVSQQGHKKHILSKRETEILKWLMQGKSSWEMSIIFRLSERTINFHVNNIMQHLGVAKRSQAVAVAMELGLIGIE